MSKNDINKIRQILDYRGRNDLSELLSQSESKIQLSSSFGSKLYSILSTFEIYSPIECTEKLRKLSKVEHNLILSAIKEVYPVRDSSPEIFDIEYYISSSMESNDIGLKNSFWPNIHSEIIGVSQKLFNDGYYAEAVFSAFKEVNIRIKNIVKNKTGEELDGKSLMLKAFRLKNPIIKLNDCLTETERNIQEGYMHLFAGSIQGIRNPKAHDNIKLDENRAVHFLYLASLLMYKIDESIP